MTSLVRVLAYTGATLALFACNGNVIGFQSPSGTGGSAAQFPRDPDDAGVVESEPPPIAVVPPDAPEFLEEPTSPDAADDGTSVESVTYDGSFSSCAQDPRVDRYSENMTKTGTRNALRFVLIESRPAPPKKGVNVLRLRIVTVDSAPSLAGDSKPFKGDLRVSLTMPDHGHSTSVLPQTTRDDSTNEYTIDPVYFFMPGVWRILLEAYFDASADAGPPVDTVSYYFCVDAPAGTLSPGGL